MNLRMMWIGIALMIAASLLLIFGPDISVRVGFGITALMLIGLGLTVGGSPDPTEKKHVHSL